MLQLLLHSFYDTQILDNACFNYGYELDKLPSSVRDEFIVFVHFNLKLILLYYWFVENNDYAKKKLS